MEAVKIVAGGAAGVIIALVVLKYGMNISWFGESPDPETPPPTPAIIDEPPRNGRTPPQPADSPPSRPRARLAVPSPEKQAEIRREIDAIFAEQLSGELSPEKKQRLALRVAQLADDAEDQPEERFVLLCKAAELAVEAGDLSRMTALVEESAGDYDFDPLAAQIAFLRQFAGNADEAEEIDSLVLHAKLVIDQARAQDRYDLAVPLAEATRAACRRPAGAEHREYVEQGCERLAVTAKRWREYQEARANLNADPDDTASNIAAARWLCLEKGQWKRGLAQLDRAGDHPLAKAARRDRAVAALPIESADQMLEAADLWFEAAVTDEDYHGFLARAHFWYTKARPSLAGEQATHADNRLDDIFVYPAARHVLGL